MNCINYVSVPGLPYIILSSVRREVSIRVTSVILEKACITFIFWEGSGGGERVRKAGGVGGGVGQSVYDRSGERGQIRRKKKEKGNGPNGLTGF